MDEKTHTEIDFKGVVNYNKNYFIQIGFFYRSLITFYPKKYLVNIIGDLELLLRSYFFTFDKKRTKKILMLLKIITVSIKLNLMFLNLTTINWLPCQPARLLTALITSIRTLIFAMALIFLP
ncbi:hypothetical protein [Spiroplasma endosymbiont of Agriotes lineatus]|uniref:hypothetical protein n=1 Tax=Spiroplasma endosymbiont of Agriotes lineatus TaxID=3077930 RepID=UPI0030D57773